MLVLKFLKFIGILPSENVMTLDWIDGVSIRETEELKE
jgi:predicted unusual protein kinase regulating ubiquinone biosynthesis (AarF/ABC1/UbiB family)